MGLRNWMHNKKMSDPVSGTYQLTGCSSFSGGAAHENCHMHGVVTGPGVGPVAVAHYCTAPAKSWPHVGEVLPVTVDRADPSRLEINWKALPSNQDRAQQAAEQLARSMGGTTPTSTSGPRAGMPQSAAPIDRTVETTTMSFDPSNPQVAGLPGQVQSLIDQITQAARAQGATVSTDVRYTVAGDPGRAMPGSPGGGLTPEQTAAALAGDPAAAGLQRATARVLAVHDVTLPPGMPGGGAAGVADLTLDVALPTGEGYTTTMRLTFSTPERRAKVATVGLTLPVLVNPAARDQIAVDTARLT